ncbi:sn-glycerol-3-phosphate ABC transporter ATP-binding protein UgpC [Variovorax sp. J22R133]|uniref:ABC transporter ATP-binding protein n=1 Tax=Variovorax brevis TaxID=3053503 RepID=UPI002575252D|nr:sn-glycerol-3-phosphate ABC transporter ATP-binding protein UgpC [Variovorax sp. J22R133]MDM0110623.1 sn-glycerol-3-phosphate ABC transporter ATP-binding protein UgpC [Variovorax sp. J22R133]
MSSITLRNIVKHYGTTPVIHGIDLDIAEGEFVALVGPSGCGKSTLLRALAGLEPISDGEIRIGNDLVNDVAPKDRNIAMVFQNYALYPHMTVEQNLGFSLSLQRLDKAEIRRRVGEAAAILGLDALLGRFPRQLSGGQRQRVAMGRAIVRKPRAFLFDEPLSNLDAKLRVQMRTEIKALHQRLGTTTLYVTHDQVEAMTMADRIVVLKDGVIEQVGSPLELYDRPVNAFVAGFIGSPSMNFLAGRIDLSGEAGVAQVITDDGLRLPLPGTPAVTHGHRVVYGARPEHFEITQHGDGLPAEVIVVEPTGSETQIALRVGAQDIVAAFRERVVVRPGERISVRPQAAHVHVFDRDSGLRLLAA